MGWGVGEKRIGWEDKMILIPVALLLVRERRVNIYRERRRRAGKREWEKG